MVFRRSVCERLEHREHYTLYDMNYKYHLASPEEQRKHGGKSTCPQCGQRRFVPYLDAHGKIVDERLYGRCERVNHCGYILYPDSGDSVAQLNYKPIYKPKPKAIYLNAELREKYFKPTLAEFETNHLIIYLRTVFNDATVCKTIEDYYIGTIDHFNGGATVFWQIDRYGNIHRGKVMQYDPNTGKRAKKYNGNGLINSIHNIYNLGNLPPQCLFGEHLLKRQNMFVGLVESEKTAIIASGVVSDCIFLACGGCGNLTNAMCEPLRGRNVVLFPDNGKLAEWSEKGQEMRHLFKTISIVDIMEREDILERYHLKDGDDIADMITAPNFNIKDFIIDLKEL